MGATAKAKRRRKCGSTPIELAARSANVDAGAAAQAQPNKVEPAPQLFDPGILFAKEVNAARHTALVFEAWLHLLCFRHGIPLQPSLKAIELLALFVEVSLVDRIQNSEFYRVVEDEPDADESAMNEDRALAMGLTIVHPEEPRVRPKCILPGCRGELITGEKCLRLREYGERFCPGCRKLYVEMMRRPE